MRICPLEDIDSVMGAGNYLESMTEVWLEAIAWNKKKLSFLKWTKQSI